ncbi:MAG: GGDEF domain-containing protein [Solirubrobacteraceae bacterium]|nr:GGDEF domain-containing protein [Solirubrobacteraceae bacterium]
MRLLEGDGSAAEATRLRHLDNEARLRPVLGVLALFGAAAMVAAVFVAPLWTVGVAVGTTLAIGFVSALTQHRLRHSPHPEAWLAIEQIVGTLALCVVLAVTGGLESAATGLMALALALVGARFQGRRLIGMAVLNITMLLGACFIADPQSFIDDGPALYTWIATMIGVTALTTILSHSERNARADAVLDPLTGMLNRSALKRRVAELEGQAAVSGLPVSVLACDLDGFKAVNDTRGHEAGDAVLQDVAYALRKTLRSFELVYRTGGDEFLVVLPGADAPAATRIADSLREAVAALGDHAAGVTLSVGVASAVGTGVVFAALSAKADKALYQAKREGRNRTVFDGPSRAAAA